eukprot:4427037-Pyramimonas_sp.AAC.1
MRALDAIWVVRHTAGPPRSSHVGDSCAVGSLQGRRELSTRSGWDCTPLDVPGSHESGDSCAVGSLPGQRES